MKNGYYKKGLVLGIIFLFIGTGFFPLISASTENNVKEDLSASNKQYPPQLYGNFIVIGFLEIINDSPGNDQIYWRCTLFALVVGIDNDANFVLLPIKKDQHLTTIGFTTGLISIIVYGRCSYFSIG